MLELLTVSLIVLCVVLRMLFYLLIVSFVLLYVYRYSCRRDMEAVNLRLKEHDQRIRTLEFERRI